MKNMTKGILASLSAAAVITTGALIGVSATTAEPTPEKTPAPVVLTVEENTLRQETPEISRPTVVIPPVVVIDTPAPQPEPAPEPQPEPEREAISGSDCPPPNVEVDGRCNTPICRVLEDGTQIPCEG